ncbi:MAG TPA: formylglycine-generating enzyme family protein [Armatimonadota bacterium]|jgi:formylglycine-generating enzyme required for sulfatase activity
MQKVILVLACALVVVAWMADAHAEIVTKINPKDGAEMALIPAGEFLMGASAEERAAWQQAHPTGYKRDWLDDAPQHKVYLDAYYLYKTEVTVAQYRAFCQATRRKMPSEPPWKWQDTQPICNVNWNDAKAYADWAGVTLPTEAQWEKAARGGDGRSYPWGNAWPPPAKAGEFCRSRLATRLPQGAHPRRGLQ